MTTQKNETPSHRKTVRDPVGPRLKRLLYVVFGLFALLGVNAIYLLAIRGMEWWTGHIYQNLFYLQMFLLHLVLGLLIVVPVIAFGVLHIRNTYNRKNRRAVRAGYGLFTAALLLLISGIVLTRIEGVLEINNANVRGVAYWLHLATPLIVVWLYVLHRLAGKRIKWQLGAVWASFAAVFAAAMIVLHAQDPRDWNVVGPVSGERYFFPSLARTSTGNFIPKRVLDNDAYCAECHRDVHSGWEHSAHHFSSFNNAPYEFSVKQTRKALMERTGSTHASRFCGGCHDPVPFFTGEFDDPKYDDPDYDLSADPSAQAGITCTVCHAISHVNSVRGNADYTIDEPIHYPFAFSDQPALQWINRQLVKAKPRFHKQTFLKPLHRSTEFCGVCHKVHLPPELNDYKWLRGQNHYDSFRLSGVSGQGISSFYYPPKAEANCNRCHMPLIAVEHSSSTPNFSARVRDESNSLKTLNHLFPSANTAIPYLVRDQLGGYEDVIRSHQEFVKGIIRVDVFGIREAGRIDGELSAPLDVKRPRLQPGKTYLIETVIRTLKLGHEFTQGTADSNEVWLEATASLNGQAIGRSGGLSNDGTVDPWSHFANAFVIDREGNRIDRRNAEDIFISLYNHQIPPGAADAVHFRLRIPADAEGQLTIHVRLRYRKFDTTYMRFVTGRQDYVNDLPILELAEDTVVLQVGGDDQADSAQVSRNDHPLWQRWNDYGIGLLRAGQLRQAEEAFQQVARLGYPDGEINLARVYLGEGRVAEEAPAALRRANELSKSAERPANEWTLLWFGGLVNKQNGQLPGAISNFRQILEGGFAQAEGRGFDFSTDCRVLNELADAVYLLALGQRGDDGNQRKQELLLEAAEHYQRSLLYDPENAATHYGLTRIYDELGDDERSRQHAALHARYKVDDNARDIAIAKARQRYPAANHAAEAVVIYDLQKEE